MSEWPTEQEYKYYLHGVKTERERIIKLLEENVQNHNLNDPLTPKLIALIKGEK